MRRVKVVKMQSIVMRCFANEKNWQKCMEIFANKKQKALKESYAQLSKLTRKSFLLWTFLLIENKEKLLRTHE